jgi:hypothetical protein
LPSFIIQTLVRRTVALGDVAGLLGGSFHGFPKNTRKYFWIGFLQRFAHRCCSRRT